MKLFALGWKGWVEVREASSPPIKNHSTIRHLANGKQYWDRPVKVQIKQFCFKGGKFLLSLPRPKFYSLTKLPTPQGCVIPIPDEIKSKLLELQHGTPAAHH